jgi:hypothetical protein
MLMVELVGLLHLAISMVFEGRPKVLNVDSKNSYESCSLGLCT